jgi:hypothetical protein
VIPLCDKYVAHEASVIHIILDHFDHSLFVEWRVLCGQDRRDADNHSEEDEACAQGQSNLLNSICLGYAELGTAVPYDFEHAMNGSRGDAIQIWSGALSGDHLCWVIPSKGIACIIGEY